MQTFKEDALSKVMKSGVDKLKPSLVTPDAEAESSGCRKLRGSTELPVDEARDANKVRSERERHRATIVLPRAAMEKANEIALENV